MNPCDGLSKEFCIKFSECHKCLWVVCVVLTAETMNSCIFRDITTCSLVKCVDFSEEHITSIFRVEEYLLLASNAGSFLGLHLGPQDESDMFIGNVDWLSPDYTVLYLQLSLYSVNICENRPH
jgi:hypothetical protein